MAISTDGLISILENAINTCCRQHNYCNNCEQAKSCTDLWGNVFKKSLSSPLTYQQLMEYTAAFNRLRDSTQALPVKP